jgi:hypothetical protein
MLRPDAFAAVATFVVVGASAGCASGASDRREPCPRPASYQPSPGDFSASLDLDSFATVSSSGSEPTPILLSDGNIAVRPAMSGCEALPDKPCQIDVRALEVVLHDFTVGEVVVAELVLTLDEVAGLLDRGGGVAVPASTPAGVHAIIDGACMKESATWKSLVVDFSEAFPTSSVQGEFTIDFDVPQRLRPKGLVGAFHLRFDGMLHARTEAWRASP